MLIKAINDWLYSFRGRQDNIIAMQVLLKYLIPEKKEHLKRYCSYLKHCEMIEYLIASAMISR